MGYFEKSTWKSSIRAHKQLTVLTCCLIEELAEQIVRRLNVNYFSKIVKIALLSSYKLRRFERNYHQRWSTNLGFTAGSTILYNKRLLATSLLNSMCFRLVILLLSLIWTQITNATMNRVNLIAYYNNMNIVSCKRDRSVIIAK